MWFLTQKWQIWSNGFDTNTGLDIWLWPKHIYYTTTWSNFSSVHLLSIRKHPRLIQNSHVKKTEIIKLWIAQSIYDCAIYWQGFYSHFLQETISLLTTEQKLATFASKSCMETTSVLEIKTDELFIALIKACMDIINIADVTVWSMNICTWSNKLQMNDGNSLILVWAISRILPHIFPIM